MDRRQSVTMAVGTLVLAFGAGQYMASGTAQSTPAMAPIAPAKATTVPVLRVAAGTPLLPRSQPDAQGDLVAIAATPQTANETPDPAEPRIAASCPLALDLFTGSDATLSVTLTAPCHPNQTLVLRHSGLAVTYQTTASGAFFADIPALEATGIVTIRLQDGSEISASSPVPDVAVISRLVVQGMAGDRFSLNSDRPAVSLGAEVGPAPLHAQVITWTGDDAPSLSIEAEVTPSTCGRELLGEVLFGEGGQITRADLTLAMPDCDGEGGFVALNNPLPDMKLAATE